MKIALIDSGIDEDKVYKQIKVIKRIDFYFSSDKKSLLNVHGTNCANIISENCSDVEFWDLRVLDENGRAPISILMDALDWCIVNKIKLLHMSLGTRSYFDMKQMEEKISRLTKRGTIIVAAYHNGNMRTYPASFPKVFGVRQDMSGVLKQKEFLFQKIKGLEEENGIVIHWWKDNLDCANSYAAAAMTGIIAEYMDKHPYTEFDEILKFLKHKAAFQKRYSESISRLLKIGQDELYIPVIIAADLNSTDIYKLTESFHARGYYCIVLQKHVTEKTGIPWDFYIDKQSNMERVCITIQKIYHPDIIILDASSENFHENQTIADLLIIKKGKKYYLSGEHLDEKLKNIKNVIENIFLYFVGNKL